MRTYVKSFVLFMRNILFYFAICLSINGICQEKPTKEQTIQWIYEHMRDAAMFSTKECLDCDKKEESTSFSIKITCWGFVDKGDTLLVRINKNYEHASEFFKYYIPISKVSNVVISNHYNDDGSIISFQDPVLIVFTKGDNIRYNLHWINEVRGIDNEKNFKGNHLFIPMKWDKEINFQERILKAFARLIEINNENDNLFR